MFLSRFFSFLNGSFINPLPTNDVYVRPQGDHRATQDVYICYNGRQKVKHCFKCSQLVLNAILMGHSLSDKFIFYPTSGTLVHSSCVLQSEILIQKNGFRMVMLISYSADKGSS